MYKPDKNNLIFLENLKKNISPLIQPLEIAVWKMKAHPFQEAPSGLWLISYELQMIALNFLLMSERITDEEAEFYFDFCWYFNLEGSDLLNQNYSFGQRRNLLPVAIERHKDAIISNLKLPSPTIETLEAYDLKYKSKFAEVAKNEYFQFADAFAKIDGAISYKEEIILKKLKQILYQSNFKKDANNHNQQANRKNLPINEAIIVAHKILKIEVGATQEQINSAYKQQVKNYHPDKAAQTTPEIAKLAEEKMKEINVAYETLKRHKYV